MIIAALLWLPLATVRAQSVPDLANKTMILVSGFPHSGTSLLLHMFTMMSHVSTMKQTCDMLYGSVHCTKGNYEGQWLISEQSAKWFHSGENFPWTERISAKNKDMLLRQWMPLWNLSRDYLVEKSPKSLLKSFLYVNLFDKTRRNKFIITLKHPMSTIAVYKDGDFRYKNRSGVSRFIDKMTRTRLSEDRNEIGWIPAFTTLVAQLSKYPQRGRNTFAIIRYEDYDLNYGSTLCDKIMRFVFEGNTEDYAAAIAQVCDKSFKGGTAVTSRKLSLNDNIEKDSLVFRHRLGNSVNRVKRYYEGYLQCSAEERSQLDAVHTVLLPFGYKVDATGYGIEYYKTHETVLDRWDLMKQSYY